MASGSFDSRKCQLRCGIRSMDNGARKSRNSCNLPLLPLHRSCHLADPSRHACHSDAETHRRRHPSNSAPSAHPPRCPSLVNCSLCLFRFCRSCSSARIAGQSARRLARLQLSCFGTWACIITPRCDKSLPLHPRPHQRTATTVVREELLTALGIPSEAAKMLLASSHLKPPSNSQHRPACSPAPASNVLLGMPSTSRI